MQQQHLQSEIRFNPVIKQLGTAEYNWLVEQRKAGKTTTDLALELTKRGFTSKRGGKIYSCDVSTFCIKNGFRQLKAYTKPNAKCNQKNFVSYGKPESSPSQGVNILKDTVPIPNMAEKYNKEFCDRNSVATEHAIAENFLTNVVFPNGFLTNGQKTKIASALLK